MSARETEKQTSGNEELPKTAHRLSTSYRQPPVSLPEPSLPGPKLTKVRFFKEKNPAVYEAPPGLMF
jgi:hypothetical protein